MKVKTADVIKDLKGKPINEDGENFTMGRVLAGALMLPDKGITPTQAADRYLLAMKLMETKEVILTAAQVTMCTDGIVKAYSPLVAGQVVVKLTK